MSWLKRLFGAKPRSTTSTETSASVAQREPEGPGNAALVAQVTAPENVSETPLLDQLEQLEEAEQGKGAAELATELEQLAAGLWYVSESDYPFAGATLEGKEGEQGAATQDEVRQALGLDPQAAVQILDAEDFWEYYTDAEIHGPEEAARFQALHDLMVDSLTEVRLVKTDGAEDWEKIVHIIGRHESGDLVGLQSTGVET